MVLLSSSRYYILLMRRLFKSLTAGSCALETGGVCLENSCFFYSTGGRRRNCYVGGMDILTCRRIIYSGGGERYGRSRWTGCCLAWQPWVAFITLRSFLRPSAEHFPTQSVNHAHWMLTILHLHTGVRFNGAMPNFLSIWGSGGVTALSVPYHQCNVSKCIICRSISMTRLGYFQWFHFQNHVKAVGLIFW